MVLYPSEQQLIIDRLHVDCHVLAPFGHVNDMKMNKLRLLGNSYAPKCRKRTHLLTKISQVNKKKGNNG